jgi:hypothetical protein
MFVSISVGWQATQKATGTMAHLGMVVELELAENNWGQINDDKDEEDDYEVGDDD